MTSSPQPLHEAQSGWAAAAAAQLRDNLRLTPAERLAIAEALLAFEMRTPLYTPKPPGVGTAK